MTLHQKSHDFCTVFPNRHHQCGLLERGIPCVDFRAGVRKHSYRCHVTDLRCCHQCCFARGINCVRVRSRIEKQLDHCSVAVRACEKYRRHAIAVREPDVRSRLNQELCSIDIVHTDHPVQRRRPVFPGRIHVDLLRQQRSHRRHIPVHGRFGQTGIRACRSDYNHERRQHKRRNHRSPCPKYRKSALIPDVELFSALTPLLSTKSFGVLPDTFPRRDSSKLTFHPPGVLVKCIGIDE